jgi:hypothetical protein
MAAGLVVSALLLAGCGQQAPNPYALPEYDATLAGPTGSASTSARPKIRPERVATPSPQVRYTPRDALGQGAWAERGRIVAGGAGQRAVVAAVTTYLSVWVQLSNTWRVDEQALAASASGEAVTKARERAEAQRQAGRRSIGRFIINISSVQVNGDHATATGCHFDATSEVDRNGDVLIAPPGGVLITMRLQRTGDTWRVLGWPDKTIASCDWRKS